MNHNNPYNYISPEDINKLSIKEPLPEEIAFLKARIQQMENTTLVNDATRYLNFLGELRLAIGFITADGDKSTGIGSEQMHPMKSAFNEINGERLQRRYIYVTDLLIRQLDPSYTTVKLDQ